jgi:transcription elongation factor Elf1
MPKYMFRCDKCEAGAVKYVPASTISIKCAACGNDMQRKIPSSVEPATVKEMVDSYMGVQLPPDNKEILESRRSEYFWTIEVPRLVQEYSPEHCLKEGWTYYDEQGKIQIHTKPPHKR